MARPKSLDPKSTRTVRVSDQSWKKARERALSEGTTANAVAGLFLEAYAAGAINAPVKEITTSFSRS